MNFILKKINGTDIVNLDHHSLTIYKNNLNIKNLYKKFKNIDKYFEFLYIRIIVNDIHKAVTTLDKGNIIEILDVNELQLLKAYCIDVKENEELSLDDLKFNVILIESESFKNDFFIFNTLLKFSSFTKNGKLYFENFNNEVTNYLDENNKKLSDYVLNSKKCFFNSTYGFNTIRRNRKQKNKNPK